MYKFINYVKIKGLIFWFQFTQQLNQPNFTGKISQTGIKSKKILMIFPEEKKNSKVAGYFLKSLDKNENNNNIDFLINKSIYHSFQFNLPINVKTYNEHQVNWLNLPKKTFIDNIFDEEYDVVVDMHPKFNFFSAYLTLKSRANTRIGFLSKYSYLFYNIEIDRKNTEFIEQSYLSLKTLLNI